MKKLSFRVDDNDAAEAQRWAEQVGMARSELIRHALRRHLLHLAAEDDAQGRLSHPLDEGKRSLREIADWGPGEDWSDWADATR